MRQGPYLLTPEMHLATPPRLVRIDQLVKSREAHTEGSSEDSSPRMEKDTGQIAADFIHERIKNRAAHSSSRQPWAALTRLASSWDQDWSRGLIQSGPFVVANNTLTICLKEEHAHTLPLGLLINTSRRLTTCAARSQYACTREASVSHLIDHYKW
jgi:hypothetical protein